MGKMFSFVVLHGEECVVLTAKYKSLKPLHFSGGFGFAERGKEGDR